MPRAAASSTCTRRPSREQALALARGEPRPARRLQPAQPRARRPRRRRRSLPALLALLPRRRGSRCAGDVRRAARAARRRRSATSGRATPSVWRRSRSRSSTGSTRRVRDRERARPRGSPPAIVTEDEAAARALPRRLSRHGGVLARADAVHRRLRADRRARDGDQRRLGAGPARAGDVPRPLAAPVPRRRRRHADR